MLAMRNLQTPKGKFTDIAPVGGGFGGVLWGSAGITVAWEAYQQFDDVALLREHYDAMSAYMSYVNSTINKKTQLSSDGQLGDWLGPQNIQLGTDFCQQLIGCDADRAGQAGGLGDRHRCCRAQHRCRR